MNERLIYGPRDLDEVESEEWTNEDTILDLCATVRAAWAERDALAEKVEGYRGLLDGAWLRGYSDALSALGAIEGTEHD